MGKEGCTSGFDGYRKKSISGSTETTMQPIQSSANLPPYGHRFDEQLLLMTTKTSIDLVANRECVHIMFWKAGLNGGNLQGGAEPEGSWNRRHAVISSCGLHSNCFFRYLQCMTTIASSLCGSQYSKL